MTLVQYLDKGASLDPAAPCLTMAGGASLTYGEVQHLSYRVARALDAAGVRPGDKVAVLSANDATAFACVFGIARAGAVWCPVNPRNEAGETRQLLDLVDCVALLHQAAFTPLVEQIRADLPSLRLVVRLDGPDAAGPVSPTLTEFLSGVTDEPFDAAPVDDLAMIAGTGGTTGRPKGVMLTGRNLETMTALTLMSYPFEGPPRYLALAPLTHAAGVLCFPVMALGGEVVVMPAPDLGQFLALVERHRVTHTFLPPTLIYLLLARPELEQADVSSLQCFWYGAAPMSVTKLEEAIRRVGPVFGQLFGQTEAPMMLTTMAPAEHVDAAGGPRTARLASAGRPTPLVTLAIMAADGSLLPRGQRGEIVVRGSLVMAGYYKDPDQTRQAWAHGWHHTGDIGYLDDEGYLYIVDRAKDMIITGGFNVYSAEVEQALMQHPAVADCAVVGLPDETWGERVTAVVTLRPGADAGAEELRVFARELLGGVKAPKQVQVWPDLPRSRVGKVLKTEVKSALAAADLGLRGGAGARPR